MASKKLVAGILITVISAGVLIGLIPVFMYGFGAQAISMDMGLNLSGTPSSSSSQGYEDFGSLTTINVDTTVVIVNPYEYFFRQFEGPAKPEESPGSLLFQEYIDFVINVNISTPTSDTHLLSFTLEDLRTYNINLLLGPNEIPIVNGTYEISIIVSITISIPDIGYNESFELGPIVIIVDVLVEQ